MKHYKSKLLSKFALLSISAFFLFSIGCAFLLGPTLLGPTRAGPKEHLDALHAQIYVGMPSSDLKELLEGKNEIENYAGVSANGYVQLEMSEGSWLCMIQLDTADGAVKSLQEGVYCLN